MFNKHLFLNVCDLYSKVVFTLGPSQRREGIGNGLFKEIKHIEADLTTILLPIPTRFLSDRNLKISISKPISARYQGSAHAQM